MGHHANMWVKYKPKTHYVISVDFEERLFALCLTKEETPKEEWYWVRCEHVKLLENKVIKYPTNNNK